MVKWSVAWVVVATWLVNVAAGPAFAGSLPGDIFSQPESTGGIVRTLLQRIEGGQPEIEGDLVKRLGSGLAKRVRRGVAFGPFVGGVAGGTLSGGSGSIFGISYGMGLYSMRQRSTLDLPRRVNERLKQRVVARVEEMVASGVPPTDLDELVRAVVEDVYRELFGELTERKLLHKPGFGAVLEGISRLEPGGTQVRCGMSYGIGPVSVGAGAGIQIASGEMSGIAGVELSMRLTPWGTLRTPVIDIHSRFDAGFAGDDSRTLVLGTRLLLDVL